ncbi:dTDP-4-dehydrorhamnose reductase [Stutzerimonas azotifigens]|uniref:dTDP-4-dehydrorhamnose reductase n=1 Tax=Stutzerimonas azotifigens TaxID=291995 RepID=UPI000425461C|nr:dTDP-4-dehydrorhamnose reductase [Stutzerimonas azotifigens]
MKLLVCGAGGQVGQALVVQAASLGYQAIAMGHDALDITRSDQVDTALARHRPDLLINAAAYTNLDHAEAEVAQARAVNARGPGNLARAAASFGIPLFHVSSDYVFSGAPGRPLRETDPTEPTGVYGATRLAGEQAIQTTHEQHLILRTSWVYGLYGNNFVKTMLKLGGKANELFVVDDQIGCPTRAQSIARVLVQLAHRYQLLGSLEWGTYHYCSREPCSWHAFAVAIFEQAVRHGLLSRSPRVWPISSERLPRRAPRPAWSVLDCERIERTFGIVPRSWRNELPHVIQLLGELPARPFHPAPSRVPYRVYR